MQQSGVDHYTLGRQQETFITPHKGANKVTAATDYSLAPVADSTVVFC